MYDNNNEECYGESEIYKTCVVSVAYMFLLNLAVLSGSMSPI